MASNVSAVAAAITQRTRKARVCITGALLPLNNPVRVAEEYALVDTLSGGRLVISPVARPIEYVEVGDGTPVVYFHGAGGVFRNAAFMPALGQRYRVLAPSRPATMVTVGRAPPHAKKPRSWRNSSARWRMEPST